MQSAKSFFSEAGLLETFMQGCEALPYDPSEWCAGIGHDVERHQFEQPWTEANPFKTWVQLPDEQTARALEDHLRGLGLNGDAHVGEPEQPPTQVYVYRHSVRELCFEG